MEETRRAAQKTASRDGARLSVSNTSSRIPVLAATIPGRPLQPAPSSTQRSGGALPRSLTSLLRCCRRTSLVLRRGSVGGGPQFRAQ